MLVTGIGRKAGGGTRWTLLAMRLLVLFAASFSMAWAVPAEAKRVALIIANSAYHRGSGKSLYNVGIDGPKVEAALKDADFDVVTLAPNLGLTEFGNALAAFQQEAMGADVALIYYAGHGIQTPAGKFAIPVDADIPSELLLKLRAINVDLMIGALSGARASILVLDACRTNGFADSWGTATRSAQFSFSTDIESTQRNLLALYSAMPGQEARDGIRGDGSPFAKAFVRYISEPGLELTQLSPRIAQAVEQETSNLQTPTSSGSMAQVIVLKQRAVEPDDPRLELGDWNRADDVGTVAAYQAFLDKWPGGRYKDLAVLAIVDLGGQPRLAARPVAIPTSPAVPPVGAPIGVNTTPLPVPGPGSAPAKPPAEPLIVSTEPDETNTGPTTIEFPTPTPTPTPNPATPPPDGLVIEDGDKTGEGTGSETDRSPSGAVGAADPAHTGNRYARSQPNGTTGTGSEGSSTANAGGPSSESEGRDAAEFQRLLREGKVSVPGFESAAEVDKAPIPQIPGPPIFSNATYPNCREDYQSYPTNRAKIAKIDECLNRLWSYSTTTLFGFVEEINAHQQRLGDLQRQTLPGEQAKFTYRPETQKKFSDDILAEFNASGPGGPYRADYEATDRREKADRAYLEGQRKIFFERAATED